MKNGDLPATPIQHMDFMHLKEKHYCNGLTKREMFAMNAPEAPSWFKNYLYINDLHYRQAEKSDAAGSESYLFFAWRTYYADALLAELERSK